MRWSCLIAIVVLLCGCQSRLPWDRPPPPGSWRIEGNQGVESGELTRAAWYELEAMSKGEHRLADAYDAAFAMEAYLRLEGYPDASVTHEGEAEGEIVFQVSEGDRACMGRVDFLGVTRFPVSTFAPWFEPPQTGLIGSGPGFYAEAQIRTGMAQVRSHYLTRGYRDVEVELLKAEWNHQHKAKNVTIQVEEGAQYRIESIVIRGDRACLIDESRWLHEPYNATSSIGMASAVRDRLGDQGYVFADVDVEKEIDEERHRAHITLIVDRGRKQHLGDVRFEGDLETKRRFLRKRIPLCEGQVITRSQLEKGLSAVYRVGAFGTMEHTLVPRGPDTSDLVVRLEEAENKRVDFGIGWGSWEMLRGTATYRDFNFTGEGRYLQATAIASIRHLGLDVLVEDPWILGDRNVLSARIGILRREERFYTFWGINTEVYVERELDDHWRVRGGYWFNAKDAFSVDPGIPAGDLDEIEGFSRSAGLFVRARWDRRDHLFVPTTGWFTEGRVSWSTPPLGANLNFVELRLRHTHFFNLGGVGVLAFHNHFASKQILDDRPTLPIQERYFLGGAESVRCFGQDQLTPVDSARSGVGGLTAYTGSLEWRVKLVGDLYAGLFVDWGMVALPSFSFDGVWGYGPGAGLRYYTPVGPVRFDLAYNPGDLLAATSRWQFHFAFGFAF